MLANLLAGNSGRYEHEVRNTGRALLKTLNFYVPPAYDEKGEELPRGRG